MALVIKTNMASLVAQSNLTKATDALNDSIEKMTTGYKINKASDDAANYTIAKTWESKLGSLDVASQNIATGSDLLTTLEDNCDLVTTHLQRIRDLTEQAANGTYGSDSKAAIKSEIQARLDEITRITANCEYNGIDLIKGDTGTEITLQVGINSGSTNQIKIDKALTKKIDISSLSAEDCAGSSAAAKLADIDTIIKDVSNRVTNIGALQNRLESAAEAVTVQTENITSSLSTIRDTDVAEESSNYIQAQILQQAASTLLATANSTPSIALSLI